MTARSHVLGFSPRCITCSTMRSSRDSPGLIHTSGCGTRNLNQMGGQAVGQTALTFLIGAGGDSHPAEWLAGVVYLSSAVKLRR
jgi:hypothetical protein